MEIVSVLKMDYSFFCFGYITLTGQQCEVISMKPQDTITQLHIEFLSYTVSMLKSFAIFIKRLCTVSRHPFFSHLQLTHLLFLAISKLLYNQVAASQTEKHMYTSVCKKCQYVISHVVPRLFMKIKIGKKGHKNVHLNF